MNDELRSRIQLVDEREQVPDGFRHHYDAIADTRGSVIGPFRVLLNSPEVGGRVGQLGAYLRYESSLPDDERELTILATAREWECVFEWLVHEPIARETALGDTVIETIAADAPVDGVSEPEAIIIQYIRELLRENRVSEPTFEAAMEHFGREAMVEFTTTIGYYSMLACVLNAFDVRTDDTPSWHR